MISAIHPNLGKMQGGTEVIVEGKNFYTSYGKVNCVFGPQQVDARIIEFGEKIICQSPSHSTQDQLVDFKVSIDGMQHALGNKTVQFLYVANEIAFSNVEPIEQDFWGKKSIKFSS